MLCTKWSEYTLVNIYLSFLVSNELNIFRLETVSQLESVLELQLELERNVDVKEEFDFLRALGFFWKFCRNI